VWGAGRLRRWFMPTWMGRELSIIFLARVLMSATRALAGVLVPIYLAEQGFSALDLGALFVVVALAAAAISSGVGILSDRIGRRIFLIVLPLFAAGAAVAFAITRDVGVLFATAALGSFGRGAGAGAGAVGPYQPAESALAMDVTPANRRNAAFGRLAFGSSIGASAGGLLALLAPDSHLHGNGALTADRPAFLVMAALAVSAGLVALALREPVRSHRERGAPTRPKFPRHSAWLLYRLWATNGVNGLAIGMFGPFVTYWLYRRYGAGPAEVGVLFSVINLATAASTLSAAPLAHRFGLVRTVTVVRSLQAVLLVPMVLAPTFLVAGGVYLVRMVVQRIGLPLRQSYVVAMADPDERASVAALSNLPSQAAMAASPVLSGYLLDSVSLELPFEIAGVLQLANAWMFWGFFRRSPPEEESVAGTALPDPTA